MIRVAFSLIGGRVWTGGNNYLHNLVSVLTGHQRQAVQPVIFFGTDTEPHERAPFERIDGVEVVCSPLMNAERKTRSLLQSLLIGRDAAMLALYKAHRIDCVFEAATVLGWRSELPAVAWMPDLQHRDLPRLFTPLAWWKRELGFRAQIAAGRTVLVSSEHTRKDCERLYPATRGRVKAVRFAVPAPPAVDAAAARAVADGYQLPERYFFLPNQFWTHKNHRLVVDALALLKREGRDDIVVAATGKPFDPRDPGHFDRLQASIAEQGVSSQMRILGLVPYEHLAPLMSASVALLNPSLLEGWSTTVEEARAQGAPMILSDLPVHREQMGDGAIYFDPHDPQALAAALRHWRPLDPEERRARAQAQRGEAARRVATYASDFVQFLQFTCRQRGAPKF